MNNYEGVFIIKEMENQEKIDKIIKKIREFIKSVGGTDLEGKNMGLKKLAYEIKGNKQGIYYSCYFKVDKNDDDYNKVQIKMKELLNTIDEVIKYIVIRIND